MKKILMILVLFGNYQIHAQVNTAKLDSLLIQLETNDKAMLNLGISSKGKMVYQNAIGFADMDQHLKSNNETIFRIGSVSKMFTAVMIMQLIEEKKINLDSKLSQFYPQVKNSDKITISNLLNHRSGLFNITEDESYSFLLSNPMTNGSFLKLVEKHEPVFEPNSKASYSNTNYILLSMIIEMVTKNSYANELESRICKKVNLSHTKIAETIVPDNNMAYSYEYKKRKWVKSTETHPTIPKGAGAIQSIPSDLCTFIEALFDFKLISENSLNEMMKMEDTYGKGIFMFPFYDNQSYGHNGSIDGFKSMLTYFPKDKVSLCILSNGLNYNFNNLLLGVLKIYYNKEYTIPNFEKRILTDEEKKSKTGEYNNENLGVKISITENNGQLFGQVTGQSSFPLQKISPLEYKFEPAQVVILFEQIEDGTIPSLTLFQNGNEIDFEK